MYSCWNLLNVKPDYVTALIIYKKQNKVSAE